MLTPDSSRVQLLAACLLMGFGMGCSMLSLLLAVQHGVDRSHLGVATSLNQFSRSIGASVGVAAMGALMSRALAGAELPAGGTALGASAVALSGPLRLQFAAALDQVFWLGTAIAVLALIVTFFLPPVEFPRGVPASAGEQMLAAEMATLEAREEPVAVPD
jgi:hypothetical protein